MVEDHFISSTAILCGFTSLSPLTSTFTGLRHACDLMYRLAQEIIQQSFEEHIREYLQIGILYFYRYCGTVNITWGSYSDKGCYQFYIYVMRQITMITGCERARKRGYSNIPE